MKKELSLLFSQLYSLLDNWENTNNPYVERTKIESKIESLLLK